MMKLDVTITLSPPKEDPSLTEMDEAMSGELAAFEQWLRKKDIAMDRQPSKLSAIETATVRAFMNFAYTKDP